MRRDKNCLKFQHWTNVPFPFVLWNNFLIDWVIWWAILDGAMNGFDSFYSVEVGSGLSQFTVPCILLQKLLAESYLHSLTDQSFSLPAFLLKIFDAMTIALLLLCSVTHLEYGYFGSLSQFLSWQLREKAVPAMLAQSIGAQIILFLNRKQIDVHLGQLSNASYPHSLIRTPDCKP